MALFPGSGTALHVGRNEATLAACVAEPKTHEEIERELTERDNVSGEINSVDVDGGGEVSRRMGVARALLVQSQEAKTRGRVILLKRGGAPESMIGLGGGFVRRAQLSSMLSASLTLEDKVTKDEIDGDEGKGEDDEKGVGRTVSKLNTVAIDSKAHLKRKSRKRRIDDSSDDSEEGGVDNDADSDDSEEVKMEEGGGGEGREGGEIVNADEDEGISEEDASSAAASGANKVNRATSRIAYEEKEVIDDDVSGDDDGGGDNDDEETDNDDDEEKTVDNLKRDDGRKRSSKSNHPKSRGSRTGLPTSADTSKQVDDELVSHRGYVLVKGGRGGAVDHVTSTPCGVCPVASKCEPGGLISPTSCIYLSQWMEF